MSDHNDTYHKAAATLAAALIQARATCGGTPQQLLLTPSDAAALYLDCLAAIQSERKKRERSEAARAALADALAA
jgi:hypothetical protein